MSFSALMAECVGGGVSILACYRCWKPSSAASREMMLPDQ